jgi:hypothetical protein
MGVYRSMRSGPELGKWERRALWLERSRLHRHDEPTGLSLSLPSSPRQRGEAGGRFPRDAGLVPQLGPAEDGVGAAAALLPASDRARRRSGARVPPAWPRA